MRHVLIADQHDARTIGADGKALIIAGNAEPDDDGRCWRTGIARADRRPAAFDGTKCFVGRLGRSIAGLIIAVGPYPEADRANEHQRHLTVHQADVIECTLEIGRDEWLAL